MKKFLLSLLMLCTVGIWASAETATLNYTTLGLESGYKQATYTIPNIGIAFSFSATNQSSTIGIAKNGGYIGITANPNNYTIKSIKVTVKTGSGKTTSYDVNKNSDAYNFGETLPVTVSSLAGTKVITQTISTTETTYAHDIDAPYFAIRNSTNNGQLQIKSIEVTYESATPADPSKTDATLAWSAEDCTVNYGETYEFPTLTVTPDAAKAAVAYSSSEETVAKIDAATGAIEVIGRGTTTIKAEIKDNDTYNNATATYTLTVNKPVTTIAETLTLAKNDEFTVGYDLTVAYATAGAAFAYDKDGSFIQLYGTNSYEAGDIIKAGWTGKYAPYTQNGQTISTPEITPVGTFPSASGEKATVTIATVDYADLTTADVNKVVKIANVFFEDATPSTRTNFTGTVNGTSVALYNNYTLESVESGYYNITIVVAINSGKLSNYITNYEKAGADTRIETSIEWKNVGEGTLTVDITKGMPAELPYIVCTPEEIEASVAYASSDESVATIDEDGKIEILAAGTTTIKASLKNEEGYKDSEAEFNLVVVDPNAPQIVELEYTFDFTSADAINGYGYTAPENKSSGTVLSKETALNSKFVTLVIDNTIVSENVTNNPENSMMRFWHKTDDTYEVRCGSGGGKLGIPMTFSTSVGTITKIEFTATTINISDLKNKIWTGSETEVTLKTTDANNITAIKVTVSAEQPKAPKPYALVYDDATKKYTKVEYTDEINAKGHSLHIFFDKVDGQKIYHKHSQTHGIVAKSEIAEEDIIDGTQTAEAEAMAFHLAATLLADDAASASDNEYAEYDHDTYIRHTAAGEFSFYAKDEATGLQSEVATVTTNENSGITGIEDIAADAAEGAVEYYNLQGVRVVNPTSGIYVRVAAGKAVKVVK